MLRVPFCSLEVFGMHELGVGATYHVSAPGYAMGCRGLRASSRTYVALFARCCYVIGAFASAQAVRRSNRRPLLAPRPRRRVTVVDNVVDECQRRTLFRVEYVRVDITTGRVGSGRVWDRRVPGDPPRHRKQVGAPDDSHMPRAPEIAIQEQYVLRYRYMTGTCICHCRR